MITNEFSLAGIFLRDYIKHFLSDCAICPKKFYELTCIYCDNRGYAVKTRVIYYITNIFIFVILESRVIQILVCIQKKHFSYGRNI